MENKMFNLIISILTNFNINWNEWENIKNKIDSKYWDSIKISTIRKD